MHYTVQLHQIVANDITRMLRRMSPKLVKEECKELIRVLDNANNRLKYSGYNYFERLHIIESGITNYRKGKRASMEKRERMFQTEEEASEKRDKKKLAVRETWYRLQIVKKKKELRKKKFPWTHSSQKKRQTNPPPPPEPQPPPTPPISGIQPLGSKKVIPEEVISVLFVPRTPHSELARMIRRDEHTISKLSGYRIKIVERCGSKLIDLL